MGYQILQGDPTEYEVIEYPSFADEREFSRLLVKTDEAIVSRPQKKNLCEKWGWDVEEVCSEKVSGYVQYHAKLAQIIFQDAPQLSQGDADQLLPGKIQEARADFTQGCRGRSVGQDSGFRQDLMAAMKSLLAQNSQTSKTEAATTETP